MTSLSFKWSGPALVSDELKITNGSYMVGNQCGDQRILLLKSVMTLTGLFFLLRYYFYGCFEEVGKVGSCGSLGPKGERLLLHVQ